MTDPKTALLAVAAMCIGGLAFSIYSGHAVMFMAGLMMGAIAERRELRRLRAERFRLRRELATTKAKIRRIRAETVPVRDYAEMSDLLAVLTEMYENQGKRPE